MTHPSFSIHKSVSMPLGSIKFFLFLSPLLIRRRQLSLGFVFSLLLLMLFFPRFRWSGHPLIHIPPPVCLRHGSYDSSCRDPLAQHPIFFCCCSCGCCCCVKHKPLGCITKKSGMHYRARIKTCSSHPILKYTQNVTTTTRTALLGHMKALPRLKSLMIHDEMVICGRR